ncbi:TPA: hypothetical protein N0F65_010285 [Lagenidium giganteum]|uniref:Transposase n=1 Tax=Lagenidium giganteum TaxID=4803 RepID=A0AAV2YR68_9STRA|nr:TPA: hypothetical protein N0F65_010285 [Lagenidium giganteum]
MCNAVRRLTQATATYSVISASNIPDEVGNNTCEAYNFIDNVTTNIFDWMDWIVARNLPLCEVENQKTRKIVKTKPICVRTLKTAMQHVAKRIGVALADEIGTSFGLMFDGWSNNTMHFVGIFAVFAKSTPSGDSLCQHLLAISPPEDGQTADVHIEYIKTILRVYHKKIAMVQFMVADNCSTNQSIASKLEIPMVGCASHRFNLAVKLYLAEYKDLVNQIQNLMIHLRHHKNASQLAKATNLRYVEFRDAVLTVSDVEDLVPRGNAHRRIKTLADRLKDLDSVCAKLQGEDRTLTEVRLLFDACLAKYPIMPRYLLPAADIMHSPTFESAVVKIQNNGRASELRVCIPGPIGASNQQPL